MPVNVSGAVKVSYHVQSYIFIHLFYDSGEAGFAF